MRTKVLLRDLKAYLKDVIEACPSRPWPCPVCGELVQFVRRIDRELEAETVIHGGSHDV